MLKGGAYDPLKRVLDIAGATVGLIVASPILAATAGLVFFNLGHPIIFKHDRPGKHGEIFTLYKFRSMTNEDTPQGATDDEQRLTRFGKILRSTSVDELPSLVNVLKGEMSLVGPRPLLVEYLDLYTPEQARRHEVLPGITGLAQILGRNRLAWEHKFDIDVHYVDQRSMALDLKILFLTLGSLWRREGISEPGHATTSKFGANK